jgi:ElaA protein
MTDMLWQWHTFDELKPAELYAILALRQRVFIVEQHCAYLDADGLDADSLHLSGLDSEGLLCAYLRVVPPGRRFSGPSIGRVITAPEVRRFGLGLLLMREGLRMTADRYPGSPVYVSAQRYLDRFYRSLGFEPHGQPYDEDGIPHIAMVRIQA